MRRLHDSSLARRCTQAVGIFKETAVAFMQMPSVFICPVITWVLICCWITYFIAIGMYVATSNTVAENDITGYAEYTNPDDIWVVWLYLVLALFWVTQFFIAAMEFCIASSVVIWCEEPPPPSARPPARPPPDGLRRPALRPPPPPSMRRTGRYR